jgi:radical SAM/Cys-rich protein
MAHGSLFDERLAPLCPGGLRSEAVRTLQVNLGRRCNLACAHCHLECSAERGELMSDAVLDRVLALAGAERFERVDLTGGAPELHPRFRELVAALRERDQAVQLRTNLVVLDGDEELQRFLAGQAVALVASLPCYREENVRAQRGEGAFGAALRVLRMLNGRGYGRAERLPLDLVYNPGGPALPGPQRELEAAYRSHLGEEYGIVFSRLLTIANMPIGRFGRHLEERGEAAAYRRLLEESFNPATVPGLMCRRQVCVDWDGALYDCDFNLALGLPVNHGAPDRIEDYDAAALAGRRVVTGRHCFGCTAGAGSSCGGALA